MFTVQHIEKLAPKESTFKAGKKLSTVSGWEYLQKSERALWGSIKGSGKKSYLVQVDTTNIAFKCTCPSRQFPCKHAIGLLLVESGDSSAFAKSNEPDYVQDWIDKRAQRAEKVEKEVKELTEEEQEKKSSAKAKRQGDRLQATLSGVAELKRWLKDMIRIGILELPNRKDLYFTAMIERMVDSKAPGLAGWIKSLKNLKYNEERVWQDQAIAIISKLYLLISAAENLENYSTSDQLAIKGLLGWTYNQKDLSADDNTLKVKDHWLVLGSHQEVQDDLTIHRYWLYGLESGKDTLIIQFENKYTTQANLTPIIEGTTIEAELGYYPSLAPHRAFLHKQKERYQTVTHLPIVSPSWAAYSDSSLEILKQDPWSNNRSGIIAEVKLIKKENSLVAIDANKQYREITDDIDEDKISTLLLLSNSESITLSFVESIDGILPLGILKNQNYHVL